MPTTTPKSPPKKSSPAGRREDQRLLTMMFENVITKIDALDQRVMSLHDSTKDGLRSVGERLMRVETLQTGLDSSLKHVEGRINRVETDTVKTAQLEEAKANIAKLSSSQTQLQSRVTHVEALEQKITDLVAAGAPTHSFIDRARFLLILSGPVFGIIGSIVTAYVMRYFFGMATS